MLALREALLAAEGVTKAGLDEAMRYLKNTARHVLTPVLFAAWGRKPPAEA